MYSVDNTYLSYLISCNIMFGGSILEAETKEKVVYKNGLGYLLR